MEDKISDLSRNTEQCTMTRALCCLSIKEAFHRGKIIVIRILGFNSIRTGGLMVLFSELGVFSSSILYFYHILLICV